MFVFINFRWLRLVICHCHWHHPPQYYLWQVPSSMWKVFYKDFTCCPGFRGNRNWLQWLILIIHRLVFSSSSSITASELESEIDLHSSDNEVSLNCHSVLALPPSQLPCPSLTLQDNEMDCLIWWTAWSYQSICTRRLKTSYIITLVKSLNIYLNDLIIWQI